MLTLTGYWPFGLVMCDVWQLSDVVMCTSSIMHMCTISLDRYTAIRDPLRSRAARGRSPGNFWVKIGAVWLASVVIGSPLIVVGVLSPGDLLSEDGQCAIINPYYLVYGSLSAFFGPLTIMLVTFILTVRLLEREASQLAADGNGGMRRCTADRKAYPQLTGAPKTAGVSVPQGGGQRRPAMRSSWMSRFSRSEAPTTTSMLPSPNKFPHDAALPNATSGADDNPHPVDREASLRRRTSRDGDATNRAETETARALRVTSSTTACCDKLGSAGGTGSCVVDVSTSARAPLTAVSSTSDNVTNKESGSVPGRRIAFESGDVLHSERVGTAVTSSGEDRMRANDCCTDGQQTSTRLVKSTSEFSALRLPEVVSQRRFVAMTSLNSSGRVTERLRRAVVSLHPGHVTEGERCCLLKHADGVRRYVVAAADDDVINPLPVDETPYACGGGAARVSGTAAEATVVMRRSRSDSAVGIQAPACRHGDDAIQSRDRKTSPIHRLDGEGDPVIDPVTDTQRPLAVDPGGAATNTGDMIVAAVDEENGTGHLDEGQMTRSRSRSRLNDQVNKWRRQIQGPRTEARRRVSDGRHAAGDA